MVAYRKRHNLSQSEAARKAGISQALWHFLERGERDPSPDATRRLTRLLHVSAAKMHRIDTLRKRAS